MKLEWLMIPVLVPLTGCSLLPDVAHEPTLHNPYPQLSRVAVAEFFNQSSEPTVDGRQFALAYYNELQLVPGFEVVPVEVVTRVIQDHGLQLNSAEDAQQLARLLEVDAVVLGAVTDFSPYYPPRCGLRVKWYAANPCHHPIPPGYGLPWGTPEEADIPGPLVFEAEFALAKAQLATQTPEPGIAVSASDGSDDLATAGPTAGEYPLGEGDPLAERTPGQEPAPAGPPTGTTVVDVNAAGTGIGFPPDWPDPRGLISPPPQVEPPACRPSTAAVMEHTATYNGHDSEFAEALAGYYHFRDDARFGGWQGYLQRSDDFIRFCCRMHLWEMLAARGGAGETRVVWRWPQIR